MVAMIDDSNDSRKLVKKSRVMYHWACNSSVYTSHLWVYLLYGTGCTIPTPTMMILAAFAPVPFHML